MKINDRKQIEIENKSLKVWLGKAVLKINDRPSLTWAVTTPYAGTIMLWSSDGYRLHADMSDQYEDNCKVEFRKSINSDLRPPDVANIISRKYDYHVSVNINDLMQGMKLYKKAIWDSVDMTFNDDEIMLYSENDNGDNIEHTLPMQNNPRYMAQGIKFIADPRFMLDALSGFNKRDNVNLRFNAYASPMMIGETDSRFAIVMPVMKAR